MIFAMMQLLSVIPNIQGIAKACVVGYKVFEVIERVPLIADKESTSKSTENINLEDGIVFENVKFRYPTSPET
jgi:ABC-type multidrug transport system fused ATPase/permease subunit